MAPSIRSLWARRNAKSSQAASAMAEAEASASDVVAVPTHFLCPITLELMKDPVTVASGITYDRPAIERWLDAGNATCPVTHLPISGADLIPNHALRRLIQAWCVANRAHGVDRIPTPRIPLTKSEAVRILSEIAAATQRGDRRQCLDLAARVRDLARESERNRECITSSGACRILASSFEAFSGSGGRVGEILAALAAALPLDGDARERLASPAALAALAAAMRQGDLAGRLNAALVVKELVHLGGAAAAAAAATEGLPEALVGLVREPISARATKSALAASFHAIASGRRAAARFADLGMVDVALHALVDAEKSAAEKALGVVDALCGTEEGRRAARAHALAVPVLVKKMLRVSDAATQFAVSALWKVCGEGACLREAVQVGAFQKLLLVLQVGCGDRTKEKVKELLKLLNGLQGETACLQSSDFRELKKTF